MKLEQQPSQPAGAIARIRSHLLALSEAERQVADWVLTHPLAAARLSMDRIAGVCQVSDTTVLRMSRAVGFVGFTDLKLALLGDLARPSDLVHDDLEPGDEPAKVISCVFQAGQRALRETRQLLKEEDLVQVVDLLEAATSVMVVGLGGSNIVAQSLHQRLYRLGRPCHAPADVHLQLLHATQLHRGDAIVAISYSGATADMVQLLTQAQARGVATIGITGNPRSALADACDVVLAAVSQEAAGEPMAARIAQLTIVDAIAVIYAIRHLSDIRESEARYAKVIAPRTI